MYPRNVYYQLPQASTDTRANRSLVPAGLTEIDYSQTPSMRLADLWRAVLRHKFAVFFAAVLGIGAGILFGALQTPLYRARTSVQLEGYNENYFLRDFSPISPLLSNATAQNYLENEVKILRSETLSRRVAERMRNETPAAPAEEPETLRVAGRLRGFVDRFLKPNDGAHRTGLQVRRAMKVDTSLLSQVIEVYFEDPNPAVAAQGANLVVQEFVAMNREARSQVVDDTAEALSRQTSELRSKLEAASARIENFARRNGLVYAGGQTTLGEDRMRQLEDALTKAEAERVAKESRFEAASSSPGSALPDSIVTGPLRQFETELETLQRQLADAQTLYTPAYDKVRRLQAQISEIRTAIANERKAVIDRLQIEYRAASGTEKRLSEAHNGQLKTIQTETEKALQYNVLKRELETTQRLYDSVLEKVRAAGVASALSGTNVRVIDRAWPPIKPYSPNIPLSTSLGFAIGMLGGIAMVIVRGKGDKIEEPGDAALVDLPELGVILSANDKAVLDPPRRGLMSLNSTEHDLGLATWQQDSSLFAESFRSTLASILFSADMPGGVTPGLFRSAGALVITSMEPMDGKTTVVANLGVAYAETGRKVLLVDADLRRPRLHNVFNITNEWGLSDLIQSTDPVPTRDPAKLARPTQVPGLWVLPSGPGADGISKLLYSSRLDELLAVFRKEFDLVLFDTPPVKLYPDARVLGHLTDGLVLVVRANVTKRQDIWNCRQVLIQDRIPVVGTILNDCKMDASHYKSYGHYYKQDATFK